MKVVLMHDWITGFRGGERVLEAFCELFPDAPLYTLFYTKGSASSTIEDRPIRTSFLNRLPGCEGYYRRLLPLFPLAAEHMTIEERPEVVLSSSHCVIKGVPKPQDSIHISYIHSPMRYMYDQYDQYFGSQTPILNRVGARLFRRYLSDWDKDSNNNVDIMVANSRFVRERIRRYYDCDAEVIYPFVDLRDFAFLHEVAINKTDEYVMVTAFAPNKRVDIAIEAFNHLKLPLTIVGSGQLDLELRKLAGPTINFVGNVDRATVITTLARARALIFPGVEDFGITPLEALAAGTPVIAFKGGGVLETLTNEDTVFFDEAAPKSLADAVRRFESEGRQVNRERLVLFSRERFCQQIEDLVRGAKQRV